MSKRAAAPKAKPKPKPTDLESEVCDVADMVGVCNLLADHFHRQTRALQGCGVMTGKQMAEDIAAAAEPLTFGLVQLNVMARRLKAKYYEVGEGPKVG